MRLETLIADIEADLSQYKATGLIDKVSMYRWTINALKRFGQSICVLQEKVVQVKNGQAFLPNNFHSLQFAVKCDPKGYHTKEESKPVVQNSLIWKERVERSSQWNSCDPCCSTDTEKIITENIYLDDHLVSFYYERPIPLKLKKSMIRDYCAKTCRNIAVLDCPYEITINGTTMYTNFNEGTIYLQYYGIKSEEINGNQVPEIPETPRDHLREYIEYHLKMKLMEKISSNGDANAANLLGYFSAKEAQWWPLAQSDAKLTTLTPESYVKIGRNNRLKMARVEMLIPPF